MAANDNDNAEPTPTATSPVPHTGVAALLDALARALPQGAVDEIAASLARVADHDAERRVKEAAARATLEAEFAELRAALPEALARADAAERRADVLDAEITRLREALREIARASADALASATTAAPEEAAVNDDVANAMGGDASAKEAAASAQAPLVSRRKPSETAAHFRRRNRALDRAIEGRRTAPGAGGPRPTKADDGEGAAAPLS